MKQATLFLCECKKHGVILLRDGTPAGQVLDQKEGIKFVRALRDEKRITDEEEDSLRDAIFASEIPCAFEASVVFRVELVHHPRMNTAPSEVVSFSE